MEEAVRLEKRVESILVEFSFSSLELGKLTRFSSF
jgi:hypothetical protein